MKWTISEFEQGQRVVDFLKSKGVHPKIWRAIQAKNIPIINQSFFQSNYLLQLGDRIDISPAFFKSKAPTELKADILLETKNLLIVNKPANILVHPSGPQKETTLNDLVLAYYLSKSISSSPHPILRLDRNTSGIVVYAKSPSVQSQLQNAELHKTYLAVVDQNFPDTDFLYSAPIQRNEDSIIERKIGDLGKSSLTHFSVLAKTSSHTLLKCTLLTGRTHQIRLHLSSLGFPILGDTLYGKISWHSRYALHAWKLTFSGSSTISSFTATAPVPDQLKLLFPNYSF